MTTHESAPNGLLTPGEAPRDLLVVGEQRVIEELRPVAAAFELHLSGQGSVREAIKALHVGGRLVEAVVIDTLSLRDHDDARLGSLLDGLWVVADPPVPTLIAAGPGGVRYFRGMNRCEVGDATQPIAAVLGPIEAGTVSGWLRDAVEL